MKMKLDIVKDYFPESIQKVIQTIDANELPQFSVELQRADETLLDLTPMAERDYDETIYKRVFIITTAEKYEELADDETIEEKLMRIEAEPKYIVTITRRYWMQDGSWEGRKFIKIYRIDKEFKQIIQRRKQEWIQTIANFL